MNRLSLVIFILGSIILHILPVKSLGAPFPGMGSSRLTSISDSIWIPHKGFKITKPLRGWVLTPEIGSNKIIESEVSFQFVHEKSNASVYLKTETLPRSSTIENYSKRWIKEYSSFGFDVLGTKPYIQQDSKALVVDLLHPVKMMKARQIIFLKGKNTVVITCTDSTKNFETILPDCNRIARSFHWN